MMKKLSTILLLSLISLAAFAKTEIKHVIYITLDGVRWQDVMQDKSKLPIFWQEHANKMNVYGPDMMEVASIPISLPSYQSQMTGAVQACQNNECGRVKVKTMPEHLLDSLKLKRQDVVVFSSWPVIGDALESKVGTVYNSVGNVAVVDPITGKPDKVMQQLNELQATRHHYHGNRMDEYTFAQALHYFKIYQPRFMWVSLVNGDNEAHDNQIDKYHAVLHQYDDYLHQLMVTLQDLHLDKNTLVIITTDHGRGNGKNWTSHGPELPESKATWAFVMNGQLQAVNNHYSTLSIRPTIEKALQG